MGIFYQNPEVQVILAIELSNSLLFSGFKRIDVLKTLSKKKFGKISDLSKKITHEVMINNKTLSSAISGYYNWISNKYVKDFFTSFGMDDNVDITPALTTLSSQIIKEKDMNSTEKVMKVTGNMHKFIIVMMMPILIIIAIFIQDALSSLMKIQIRPMVDYVIYGLILLATIFLIPGMRDV